jgi:predicted permease
MRISVPAQLVEEPLRVTQLQNKIADKLRAIPGVTSVGFTNEMPMEAAGEDWDVIYPEGKNDPQNAIPPLYLFKYVSPDFFRTVGTRLVAGRELSWTDVYGRKPVALVSENLAREIWGAPSAAIGKRFRVFPQEPWQEVVGVVEDVHEEGLNKKAPEIVYWPPLKTNLFGRGPLSAIRSAAFAIRSERAGTEGLLEEVKRAVWSVNADLPLASVRTMQDVYDQSLAQTSFTLVMLGIASAMALVLGVVGIYGVISYVVGQRRHEIGIRVALGARSGDILRMVLVQGGKFAATGIACGVVASLGLTRLLSAMLFGVSASDPVTFASVVAVLVGVTLLASSIPARRALRVDPMMALRHE